MLRWLSCGLVALITLPLISANRVPTTQPQPLDFDEMRDLRQKLDQVQADLDAAKANLDELSKLPPIQPWHLELNSPQFVSPDLAVPRAKFDIKPHGTSFKFNGLTVYVEPIVLASTRTIPAPDARQSSSR